MQKDWKQDLALKREGQENTVKKGCIGRRGKLLEHSL